MANELRCKGSEKLTFHLLCILSVFMGEDSADKDFADKMKIGTHLPAVGRDDTDGAALYGFKSLRD